MFPDRKDELAPVPSVGIIVGAIVAVVLCMAIAAIMIIILFKRYCDNLLISFANSLVPDQAQTRPCSTVCNLSGNRCESDCRSRGREFNPGLVPYFRGD